MAGAFELDQMYDRRTALDNHLAPRSNKQILIIEDDMMQREILDGLFFVLMGNMPNRDKLIKFVKNTKEAVEAVYSSL